MAGGEGEEDGGGATGEKAGKGKRVLLLTIDHMVPWSATGPCALENLLSACTDCNHTKDALWYKDLVHDDRGACTIFPPTPPKVPQGCPFKRPDLSLSHWHTMNARVRRPRFLTFGKQGWERRRAQTTVVYVLYCWWTVGECRSAARSISSGPASCSPRSLRAASPTLPRPSGKQWRRWTQL